MPITVFTGIPGSGKTTKLAETVVNILLRNAKYYDQTGIVRPVYLNFHLNPYLEDLFSEGIKHWRNVEELSEVRDADVIIDEIGTFFDAKRWSDLSFSVRRWLSQHRKLGVEIYGNSQDFAQIDISFRRMTSKLFYLVKLISSRDPTPTKPPVKYIWGVCVVYTMSPRDYKEDQKENRTSFYNLFFITRKKTSIFDTREEIKPGEWPLLEHIERHCRLPNCPHVKVMHQ